MSSDGRFVTYKNTFLWLVDMLEIHPFCCVPWARKTKTVTLLHSLTYECFIWTLTHGTPRVCCVMNLGLCDSRRVKTGCWATTRVLYLKNKPILTCLNFKEVYSSTLIMKCFWHEARLLYWWIFSNICIFDQLIYIGSYCTGSFICCCGDYYRMI